MYKPDAHKVSDKEILGRRVFSKSDDVRPSKDAKDGGMRVRHVVFLDDNIDADLSFDRIGMKAVDAEVLSFLKPLAGAQGANKGSPFRGWASIPVKELSGYTVRPSPPVGEDHPFHAELCRNDFRNPTAARALAWHLTCIVTSRGEFIDVPLEDQSGTSTPTAPITD